MRGDEKKPVLNHQILRGPTQPNSTPLLWIRWIAHIKDIQVFAIANVCQIVLNNEARSFIEPETGTFYGMRWLRNIGNDPKRATIEIDNVILYFNVRYCTNAILSDKAENAVKVSRVMRKPVAFTGNGFINARKGQIQRLREPKHHDNRAPKRMAL